MEYDLQSQQTLNKYSYFTLSFWNCVHKVTGNKMLDTKTGKNSFVCFNIHVYSEKEITGSLSAVWLFTFMNVFWLIPQGNEYIKLLIT